MLRTIEERGGTRPPKVCKGCGKQFIPSYAWQKYCSPACYHESTRECRREKEKEYQSLYYQRHGHARGHAPRIKYRAELKGIGRALREFSWARVMKSPGWLMPHRNGDGIPCPHCGASHVLAEQLPECAEVERRREIVDEIKMQLRRRENIEVHNGRKS
jgi:hypothetical protein